VIGHFVVVEIPPLKKRGNFPCLQPKRVKSHKNTHKKKDMGELKG
jgi:hypothetical protein